MHDADSGFGLSLRQPSAPLAIADTHSNQAGNGEKPLASSLEGKDNDFMYPDHMNARTRSRYREYRLRQRKEISKTDGKVIWPERVEDAFLIGRSS